MTATSLAAEIAVGAARLIVEEGMAYGAAKKRAAREIGVSGRLAALPSNDDVEEEVRAWLALFHADSQPRELAALRDIAAEWMARVAAFRPYLAGAVWRGTATRLSDIHIELYCDDSKAAELALIDMRVDYSVSSASGPNGRAVDVLEVFASSLPLRIMVRVALSVLDYDDLRGALRGDSRGRSERGDLTGLKALAR